MNRLRTTLLAGLCMAVGSISNAGDFYVQIELNNGNALLATVDLSTGEAIPVSMTESPVVSAFDFPDIGTELIGIYNGRLQSWDYETGGASGGANVTAWSNGETSTLFSFDSGTTAYALGGNMGGGTEELYHIDIASGAATSVGAIGFRPGNNGGDIAPDGTLYFLCRDPDNALPGYADNNNSSIYVLNKADATPTFIGSTGRGLHGADLAFDCEGNLFGLTDTSRDGVTGILFSVDTSDGSTSDIVEIWSDLGEINTANLAWGPGDGCPPEIVCSLEKDCLWSNGCMVNVGLDATILTGREIADVTVEVFSDEPEGDSGFANCFSSWSWISRWWKKDDCLDADNVALETLRVRAEASRQGDGRVYLIIITATDDLGRVGKECCTVIVPRKRRQWAIDLVTEEAEIATAVCMETGAPPEDYTQVGVADCDNDGHGWGWGGWNWGWGW